MAEDQGIPDWLLERANVGEIPPEHEERLSARLAAEPELADRLARLRRSDAELLAAHPPALVVAEIERRRRMAAAEQSARAARVLRRWSVAGAAAVALLVVLVLRPDDQGTVAPETGRIDDQVRAKGTPHLLVHRKRAETSERLTEGAEVRAGDRVQLSYVAAEHRYGVVLSIDGNRVVTVHFPDPGAEPLLAQEGVTSLAHSYELDDAPAFERFFLVSSPDPVDMAAVMESARQLARHPELARTGELALPGSMHQSSILLRKVTLP